VRGVRGHGRGEGEWQGSATKNIYCTTGKWWSKTKTQKGRMKIRKKRGVMPKLNEEYTYLFK
jgi:hypothetical protein